MHAKHLLPFAAVLCAPLLLLGAAKPGPEALREKVAVARKLEEKPLHVAAAKARAEARGEPNSDAKAQAGKTPAAVPTGLPGYELQPAIFAATAREPLEIGVWPGKPFQGSLLVVDVASATAAEKVEGTFLGRPLQWHRVAPGIWRGMAPVPDDAATGPAPLAIKAGETGRIVPLEIQPVPFDQDELRVAGKFTKLSKAARKQIARDRRAVASIWKKGSAENPFFRENFALPRDARTTAPYGTRRTFNGETQSVHAGWDLDGKVGEPILAPNDGVVRMAQDLYYSGGTVFIDHGGGLYTGYFHMSSFAVKPGSKVKRGQKIGTVGKSGRVTGPHLHWAAKIGGSYINPASVMAFDFSRPMVQIPAALTVEGGKVVPAAVPR